MKKNYILPFLLMIFGLPISQAQLDCGTIGTPDPNFDENTYRLFLQQRDQQLRAIDEVPVQIHIIRTTSGSTSLSEADVLNELAISNMHYAPANIEFVPCGPVNFIDNDDFYSINDFAEADVVYDLHHVENVINVYFAEYVLGRCGYSNFPWSTRQWIFMDNQCSTNSSTLSHEFGHWFGLYHTHETAFGDELVDGSNCTTAGDRLCDTPADPRLSGLINSSCIYTGTGVDANGDAYTPNPANIMSYSRSFCRDFFSPEQVARIDFYNNNGRENLVCSSNPIAPQKEVKVALVVINPSLSNQSGQTFHERFNWNEPVALANDVVNNINAVSQGVVNYEFVETHYSDVLFSYNNGTEISPEELATLIINNTPAEIEAMGLEFDYQEVIDAYDFCTKRDAKDITEVWIYAPPFVGLYESRLAGQGAFWYNSPPLTTSSCVDLLPIMGLNFEREVAEALHSYNHRVENTMRQVYGRWDNNANPKNTWEKFTCYEDKCPGEAHAGNIHFPPNGTSDYNYNNPSSVTSYAYNWYDYPNIGNVPQTVTCSDWNCDQEGYMLWWMDKLPRYDCVDPTDGYLNNWWHYVVDYNEAVALANATNPSDCDINPTTCPTNIPGYTVLGEYNNSKYFLSDNSATWFNAQAAAAANTNGGYLVSINDAAENDFIESVIGDNIYFIGLSDNQSEGNLTWDSGEPVNYDNSTGNSASGDFGVMYFWDGKWGFESSAVWRRSIVEVPCGINPPGGELTVSYCPDDKVIGHPFNVTQTWIISFDQPTASTTCSGGVVNIVQTTGPASGTSVAVGLDYTITFEISDNCGNTSTCSFVVSFEPIPPSVNFTCPADIAITAGAGETGATVTWDENDFTVGTPCLINVLTQTSGPSNGAFFPIGTTTVTYEANGNCNAFGFLESCSFDVTVSSSGGPCPNDLAGFTALGEYNNSKYFLSDNSATWPNAQAVAANTNGGYLVSINDAAENDFIESVIGSNIYFIGLSDAQAEGALTWDSGEPVSYNNSGGNSGANDYGVFYFWDGSWGFEGGSVWRRYIVEVPCGATGPSLVVDCPADITVTAPIGVDPFVVNWEEPTGMSTCPGGVVNVIQISGPQQGSSHAVGSQFAAVYELSDNCGNVETCIVVVSVEGGVFAGTIDCPADIMLRVPAGSTGATINWPASGPSVNVNCGSVSSLTQIAGPPNNSFFPLGVTTISFEAIAVCNGINYSLFCSFEITIEEENNAPCPTDLTGFTALGEFNNSKYFLSNNSATWSNAQAAAANTNGGYLVSINDPAENDFIESVIGSNIYFIGLSDAQAEGTLTWDSGESVSYDRSGGNNGANDYGVFYFWDGSWGFEGGNVWRKYIVEVPCGSSPPTDGPDLQLSNLNGLPYNGIQGEVVNYSFDLQNTGTEIAQGDYVIGAYLSSDQVLDANDVLAGIVNTGNTDVGTITDIPSAITIPVDQAPGQYYYLILAADINNDITELDENNNTVLSTSVINIAASLENPCVVFEETYGLGSITCTELLTSGNIRLVYKLGADYFEKIIGADGVEISDQSIDISQASIKVVDNEIVETDFDGNELNAIPIDPALVALYDFEYNGFAGVDRAADGGFFLAAYERIFDAPLPTSSGVDRVFLYKLNGSGEEVNSIFVDELGTYKLLFNTPEQVLAMADGGVELYYQRAAEDATVYRYAYDANLVEVRPRETAAFARSIYGTLSFGPIEESPCVAGQYLANYINILSSSPHGGTVQSVYTVSEHGNNGKTGIFSRYSTVTSVQGFGSRDDVMTRFLPGDNSLVLTYKSLNSQNPLLPDTFLLQWIDSNDQVQKSEDQVLTYFPKDFYELADGSVLFLGERNGEIYLTNVDCGTVNRERAKEDLVEKANPIQVFPNPVMDDLQVSIESEEDRDNTLLQVFDSRGTLQLNQRVNLWKGINRIDLETQQLTGGIYYILLPEMPSRKNSASFVKVRN